MAAQRRIIEDDPRGIFGKVYTFDEWLNAKEEEKQRPKKAATSRRKPLTVKNCHDSLPSWPGEGDSAATCPRLRQMVAGKGAEEKWLPRDWSICFRQLPTGLHRCYLPPGETDAFLWHRACVEEWLVGNKQQLSKMGSSNAEPGMQDGLLECPLFWCNEDQEVSVAVTRVAEEKDKEHAAAITRLHEAKDQERAAAVARVAEEKGRDHADAVAGLHEAKGQEMVAAVARVADEKDRERVAEIARLHEAKDQERTAAVTCVAEEKDREHAAEIARMNEAMDQERAKVARLMEVKDKEIARMREEKTKMEFREGRLLGIVERFADGTAGEKGSDGFESLPAAKRPRSQPNEAGPSGQGFPEGRTATLRS